MSSRIIQKGAEANILKNGNLIIKDRIKKSYRIPELDLKIRTRRTKAETKLLEKASKIINSPKPTQEITIKNASKIKMPFIQGKRLSESLNDFSLKKQKEICKNIGKQIAKLHDSDIIHGDLTTSNFILSQDNQTIYLIDFGLGFHSHKIEDKSVDLHLLRQALEAKHFKNWKALFDQVLQGYKKYNESQKVLAQFKKVESRGRYKERY